MPPKKKPRRKVRRLQYGSISRNISESSREARRWDNNAQKSRLLRLPVEIRFMIYELVLGGNTIKIRYGPPNWKPGRTRSEHRTALGTRGKWSFSCTVGPQTMSPYLYPWFKKSQGGFALLNAVCRQLYKETATLPYKLNYFAFESWDVLKKLTMTERRLPLPQRRAIETLYMRIEMPTKTLLNFLGGIKVVNLDTGDLIEVCKVSKTDKNVWSKETIEDDRYDYCSTEEETE